MNNKQTTILLMLLFVAVVFILINEHLMKKLETRLDDADDKLDHLLSNTDQVRLALAMMIKEQHMQDFDFEQLPEREPIGFRQNQPVEA